MKDSILTHAKLNYNDVFDVSTHSLTIANVYEVIKQAHELGLFSLSDTSSWDAIVKQLSLITSIEIFETTLKEYSIPPHQGLPELFVDAYSKLNNEVDTFEQFVKLNVTTNSELELLTSKFDSGKFQTLALDFIDDESVKRRRKLDKQKLNELLDELKQRDLYDRFSIWLYESMKDWLEGKRDSLKSNRECRKLANLICDFCVNVTKFEWYTSEFNNGTFKMAWFDKQTIDGIARFSTSAPTQLMDELVLLPYQIRAQGVHLLTSIITLINKSMKSDSIFKVAEDFKNYTDQTIEKFAKEIDEQCGEGAFAAYFLYPDVYNSETYGIKRHTLLGKKPSTGKSIMGKLLLTLYGKAMSRSVAPRPVESAGGYDADVISWNESVLNWPVVNVDDDVRTERSQEDFLKNFNNEETGVKVRKSKAAHEYEYKVFKGFLSMNANSFPENLVTEEISKRVYVYHLTRQVSEYLTPEEVAHLHSIDAQTVLLKRLGLVNYLNNHREDAERWLLGYKQPDISGALGITNDLYTDYLLSELLHNAVSVDDVKLGISWDSSRKEFPDIRQSDVERVTGSLFTVKMKRMGDGTMKRRILVNDTKRFVALFDDYVERAKLMISDISDLKVSNPDASFAEFSELKDKYFGQNEVVPLIVTDGFKASGFTWSGHKLNVSHQDLPF